jgi:signal transduction histidine kinase
LEAEKVKSENNLMRIIGGGAILVLVFILLFTFWFLKARADNNLLRGLADGREQTLRDVSDRLHTEVQSELAKALKSVQALSVEHGDVAPALADIKLANTMVRDLSHDLSVTLLKYSTLQEVLWEYCEKIMERKTGLHASFTETGSNHILPKEVELALYRIAQSCTNNTLKHASAQHISMSLNCSEKMVFFQYSDDGKGFDFDQAITRGRSIGLRDMVERVKLLKGEIQPFQPAAGGAGVLISIPL